MYSFFTQLPPIVRQNAKHARYATADICCLAMNKGQTDERDSTPLCFGTPLCLDKRTICRVATLYLIVWTFLRYDQVSLINVIRLVGWPKGVISSLSIAAQQLEGVGASLVR